MHSIIMIKPDAFGVTVPADVAGQLFRDFAHFLLHRTVNPENTTSPEYSEEAVRQIRERAVSEASFRGEVLEPGVMATSLLLYAEEHFCGGRPDVAGVLEGGLRCLSGGGFCAKKLTLSPGNVETIYSGSDGDIMVRLHEYLDGREVVLADIGNTEVFVLQWWKTFSRHYFLDYSRERYPLRNLIHVAEEDSGYLKKLMEEQ